MFLGREMHDAIDLHPTRSRRGISRARIGSFSVRSSTFSFNPLSDVDATTRRRRYEERRRARVGDYEISPPRADRMHDDRARRPILVSVCDTAASPAPPFPSAPSAAPPLPLTVPSFFYTIFLFSPPFISRCEVHPSYIRLGVKCTASAEYTPRCWADVIFLRNVGDANLASERANERGNRVKINRDQFSVDRHAS